MQLSQRCLSIAASLTLEIDAQAKRMRAEGLDVIGFGAGEPDFDTPSFIKDAAKEALDQGHDQVYSRLRHRRPQAGCLRQVPEG